MFAVQRRARLGHACRVQGAVNECRARAVQRRARRAVQDQVAVGARQGAVAGVEVLRHGMRPGKAHIGGQLAVGAQHPAARGAGGFGVEVRHLALRVDAGVGASGAHQRDRGSGNARRAQSR